MNRRNDRIELYLISNSIFSSSSANTITGAELWELRTVAKYIPHTKTFSTSNASIQFQSNNVPIRGDTWSFGETDPTNFYNNQNDKLFKITGLDRDDKDFRITIHANEYISNVYIDSESAISYVPIKYKDTTSPMIPPPSPTLELLPKTVRLGDGSIRYDLEVFIFTDTSGYPLDIDTELEYGAPAFSQTIEGIS